MPGALPPPAVEPETVRRTVEEVLSRPEYRPLEPSLVERVLGWAGEQLGRVLELLARGGAGGLVAALILVGAVAVLAVLGVRFARRVRRDPHAAAAIDGDVGRSGDDWLAEARAHEAAGRWRPALRCRYRALVADLAAAGLVDEVPGRTTGEYRRQAVAALPVAAADVDAATAAFDAAWYGDAPVDADAVAALAEHGGAVRRAIRGRAVRA